MTPAQAANLAKGTAAMRAKRAARLAAQAAQSHAEAPATGQANPGHAPAPEPHAPAPDSTAPLPNPPPTPLPDPFSGPKNTFHPSAQENRNFAGENSSGLEDGGNVPRGTVGGGAAGESGKKAENMRENSGNSGVAGGPAAATGRRWRDGKDAKRKKGRVLKTERPPGLPRSGGERQAMEADERERAEREREELERIEREAVARRQAEEDAKGPRYVRAKLYPKQEGAFFGPERWSLTEATTKGGKTSGAIVWLAEKAILGKEGQNFWWVAPVFPQAEIAYRRMAKAFPYDLRATHDSKMRISLANGTAIWFKSGETPDNLYGEDVFAAVVDEASRLREESWHALRSTLTATRGQARMIGNVKGRRNWFYAMCRKAEMGAEDMAYHKLTWRDAVEAGVIDAREVEDARRLLPPAVFQELYEADAADDSGNPFGIEAIAECVARVRGLVSPDPVTCWGWDLGKRQDWSCGVGLDRNQNVAQVERFQMPWREAKERIAKVTAGLPALVDSTGVGDPVLEDLQAGGSNFEGYYFTGKSKQALMEHLRGEIQGRRIGLVDGVMRTELEQFEYTYTRTNVVYSAPDGCHDDAVIGLALASKHFATHGAGHFHFARSEKLARASYERGGRERAVLI